MEKLTMNDTIKNGKYIDKTVEEVTNYINKLVK